MAEPIANIMGYSGARPAPPINTVAIASTSVPAWAVYATLVLAIASIAISLVAALTRGPWIDEFWTLFAIDHSLSLAADFQQRWLTDVHPPLFYLVSRLLSDVLGDDLSVLRLQNAIAMVGLIAFFLFAGRNWKNAERFLLLSAVMTFSSYFATGYFPEYRSYYVQFVCGICFYACAYALLRGGLLAGARERHITIAIFIVTGVLLVNLHFVTAVLAEASFVGLAALALLLRQRRLAILICAVGLLAAGLLVQDLLLQAPALLGKAGGHFWIDTGLLTALGILAVSIAKGIGLNLVVCALAAWVLLRTLAGRVGSRDDGAMQDMIVGTAFLFLAIAPLGVLLIVNFYTPIIVDRYLLLSSAATICGIAILAKEVAFSLRWGFALVLANAVMFLGIAGHRVVAEQRWSAAAAMIGAEAAACPTTVVEAFPFPYPGALPSEGAVYALGYRYFAERFGFRVTIAEPDASIMRDETGNCPTMLWTENVLWTRSSLAGPDALVLETARSVLGPIDLDGAVVERTKTGAVIVLKPKPKS
jgi:hypothetical protein